MPIEFEGLSGRRHPSRLGKIRLGEKAVNAKGKEYPVALDHFRFDPDDPAILPMLEELFGPATLIVTASSAEALVALARDLDGQLTATLHATPADVAEHAELVRVLEGIAGRIILNGFPTGVEVGHAMQHGGPYPATTDARSTSVGTAAIERFVRPVCYQDFPDDALPPELQDANPLGIWRMVDGRMTRERVGR